MQHDLGGKIVEKVNLYNTHPFYTTSLGTFKRRLDEHHPALLQRFASLALLYKTLNLLTNLLGDSVFTRSIPVLCRSVMVSRHVYL